MTSNKLFVYGIFLSEGMRKDFGMTNARFATVKGYATVGVPGSLGNIVEAIRVSKDFYLSGLIVDVPPKVITPQGVMSNWERLDRLEGSYDRKMVTTAEYDKCWMYVAK